MKKLMILLMLIAITASAALAEQPELHTLWGMEFGTATLKQFCEIANRKMAVEFVQTDDVYITKVIAKDEAMIEFMGNPAALVAYFTGQDQSAVLDRIVFQIETDDPSPIIAETIYTELINKFGLPDDQVIGGIADGEDLFREAPQNSGIADFDEIQRIAPEYEKDFGLGVIWKNATMYAMLKNDGAAIEFSLSSDLGNFDRLDVEGRTRDAADGLK